VKHSTQETAGIEQTSARDDEQPVRKHRGGDRGDLRPQVRGTPLTFWPRLGLEDAEKFAGVSTTGTSGATQR